MTELTGSQTAMTPERFLERVLELEGPWGRNWASDPEHSHGETDRLMEEVLIGLGYGAGVDLIRKQIRWYA